MAIDDVKTTETTGRPLSSFHGSDASGEAGEKLKKPHSNSPALCSESQGSTNNSHTHNSNDDSPSTTIDTLEFSLSTISSTTDSDIQQMTATTLEDDLTHISLIRHSRDGDEMCSTARSSGDLSHWRGVENLHRDLHITSESVSEEDNNSDIDFHLSSRLGDHSDITQVSRIIEDVGNTTRSFSYTNNDTESSRNVDDRSDFDLTNVSRVNTAEDDTGEKFNISSSVNLSSGAEGSFMASTPRRHPNRAGVDDSDMFEPTRLFSSTSLQKEQQPDSARKRGERTIFEEIVETQTEIVVESTYEVETNINHHENNTNLRTSNTEQIKIAAAAEKEILRIPNIVVDDTHTKLECSDIYHTTKTSDEPSSLPNISIDQDSSNSRDLQKVNVINEQSSPSTSSSSIQSKDLLSKLVEDSNEQRNEVESQESPPLTSLDESTLSLADGDVLDTTFDLKEAIVNEQSEPRRIEEPLQDSASSNSDTMKTSNSGKHETPFNVAKALLRDQDYVDSKKDCKDKDEQQQQSPVVKRRRANKSSNNKVARSDSWKYSSDYKLSRKSASLIESIELDMDDETMDDLDPHQDEVDKNVKEMLDVRANLRRVDDGDNKSSVDTIKLSGERNRKTSHGDTKNPAATTPPPTKAKPNTRNTVTKNDGDNKPYRDNKSTLITSPRLLKTISKGREWKSRSLHSIFSADQTETDIDSVDDNELMDILKSR